jgi:hypothetical protein
MRPLQNVGKTCLCYKMWVVLYRLNPRTVANKEPCYRCLCSLYLNYNLSQQNEAPCSNSSKVHVISLNSPITFWVFGVVGLSRHRSIIWSIARNYEFKVITSKFKQVPVYIAYAYTVVEWLLTAHDTTCEFVLSHIKWLNKTGVTSLTNQLYYCITLGRKHALKWIPSSQLSSIKYPPCDLMSLPPNPTQEFLTFLDQRVAAKNRRILLFVGQCTAHSKYVRSSNNVRLESLPANTTVDLQLTGQGIIISLKQRCQTSCLQVHSTHHKYKRNSESFFIWCTNNVDKLWVSKPFQTVFRR